MSNQTMSEEMFFLNSLTSYLIISLTSSPFDNQEGY